MSTDANPLLNLDFRIPFDRIHADHVEPAIAELLRQARAGPGGPGPPPAGPRTCDNTMAALDELTEPLDRAMAVVRHLEAVATYPELRAAHNAVEPEVSAFYTSIPLNAGLWKNIKAYRRHGRRRGRSRAPRRRFLHEDHGHLPPPRRGPGRRRQDAPGRRSTSSWRSSPRSSPRTCSIPPTPGNWCCRATRRSWPGCRRAPSPPPARAPRGRACAGWRFTLQAPSYIAVMTYLDDAAIRRQVYRAYQRPRHRGTARQPRR